MTTESTTAEPTVQRLCDNGDGKPVLHNGLCTTCYHRQRVILSIKRSQRLWAIAAEAGADPMDLFDRALDLFETATHAVLGVEGP